jgi:hypothetical protein
MEALIKSVKKFSIDYNVETFEDSLNDVVSKMETMDLITPEWDNLKSNFTKLRYLDYLISKNNIPLSDNFHKSLEIFLNGLDTVSQHYLNNIDFEMESYHPELLVKTKKIKELLELSLNCNENITKMKHILGAYIRLVSIVEGIVNEPFKEEPLDPAFLRKFKRQKTK